MKKSIGFYPRGRVEGGGRGVVSQAGAVLLVETVRKSGLDGAISAAPAPWRKPRAVHDPGKILLEGRRPHAQPRPRRMAGPAAIPALTCPDTAFCSTLEKKRTRIRRTSGIP